MTTSDTEIVAALGPVIIQRIGEPRYNLWFERRTKLSWEDELLTVGVSSRHYQEWLENKFGDAIRAAAADVLGQPTQVRFVIDPELFQAARREQTEVEASRRTVGAPANAKLPCAADVAETRERTEPAAAPRLVGAAKRRWLRLSDFVVGACNRVAHASALSVIEEPGQGPNPLILHGPVGTGKSHLLQGIYAGLRKHRPDWRVCYVTAEDFTNRFVQAMRLGKLGAFRKHFRDCDAFLLDDLHFLARKQATQEEFLHTFDALHSEGKQLVATCDVHPKLGDEFTAELADRLLGGSVWGLTPPDAETRFTILQAKSFQSGGPSIPDSVLRHVAEHLRGNVRELEGALHSLRHYSRVAGRPVDMSLAREALADLLRHAVRVHQLGDVDQAVCRVLRLSANALQSKQRAWAVSHPRMLAIYLARKHTSAAYSEIGSYFGGRNHSTAVAAEKKVRQWIQANEELPVGDRRLRVRDVLELVERELLR